MGKYYAEKKKMPQIFEIRVLKLLLNVTVDAALEGPSNFTQSPAQISLSLSLSLSLSVFLPPFSLMLPIKCSQTVLHCSCGSHSALASVKP